GRGGGVAARRRYVAEAWALGLVADVERRLYRGWCATGRGGRRDLDAPLSGDVEGGVGKVERNIVGISVSLLALIVRVGAGDAERDELGVGFAGGRAGRAVGGG